MTQPYQYQAFDRARWWQSFNKQHNIGNNNKKTSKSTTLTVTETISTSTYNPLPSPINTKLLIGLGGGRVSLKQQQKTTT